MRGKVVNSQLVSRLRFSSCQRDYALRGEKNALSFWQNSSLKIGKIHIWLNFFISAC